MSFDVLTSGGGSFSPTFATNANRIYIDANSTVVGARDGSFYRPYLSLATAVASVPQPTTQAEYESTLQFICLEGSPETADLDLPFYSNIVFSGVGKEINGDITLDVDDNLRFGSTEAPELEFRAEKGLGFLIVGDITIKKASGGAALTGSSRLQLIFANSTGNFGTIYIADGVNLGGASDDIGISAALRLLNNGAVQNVNGTKTLIDSSDLSIPGIFAGTLVIENISAYTSVFNVALIEIHGTGTPTITMLSSSFNSTGDLDIKNTLNYSNYNVDSTTLSEINNNLTIIGQPFTPTPINDADTIKIADAGGYYTSDEVEGALQEIGAGTVTFGTADEQVLFNDAGTISGDAGFLYDSAGQILKLTNGIQVNPGSDTDADLITVGVTGNPTISWDESEDEFLFTDRIRITDYFFQDSLGNNALGLNAASSVTTGTDNVFLGTAAGTALTEGANNCFFGRQAGASLTTGDDNWIAGFRAGQNLTTGNQNTLGGSLAGQNLTDGSFNVCLGLSSGNNLGSGSNNVAIGRVSLANYTGSTAVAIGYAALRNTTGTSNIGIGYLAGNDLVTGTGNVLLGVSSGQNLDGGSRNMAIGFRSLYYGTGNDNDAIGYQALQGVNGVSDFDDCIGIGYQTGYLTETSTGNIYIGREAGYKPNNLVANATTTGSYQNFIGYRAGLGSSTQRDNVTAIGKNAVVDADNTCVIGGQGSDAQTLVTTGGRQHNTTRLTSGDSPYDVLYTDHEIFCDTDGGAITVNLPAGIDGTNLRIINCGSSNNDVTVTPDGSELLKGANSSQTLSDGSTLIITYETTEGWW